jgi:hypothetical protein
MEGLPSLLEVRASRPYRGGVHTRDVEELGSGRRDGALQESGETNRDLDRHQPTDERLRRSKDEGRDRQQHHATEVQPGPSSASKAQRLAPASKARATNTRIRTGRPLRITASRDQQMSNSRAWPLISA